MQQSSTPHTRLAPACISTREDSPRLAARAPRNKGAFRNKESMLGLLRCTILFKTVISCRVKHHILLQLWDRSHLGL